MKKSKKITTKDLTLAAVLTALVVVLQLLGGMIPKVGTAEISLVLLPIVIGGSIFGEKMGAWLGLVFGVVVLMLPGTAWFMSFSVVGTVVIVLLKGIACGFFSGLAYKLLKNGNKYVATLVSSVVCPVVNTGIFVIGVFIFFSGTDVIKIVLTTALLVNFTVELAINLVFNPLIIRIINFRNN